MTNSDLCSFDWLKDFRGVVDVDLDSESPTRWRVELKTDEDAATLVAALKLIDCDCARTRRSPTVVIVEPEGH